MTSQTVPAAGTIIQSAIIHQWRAAMSLTMTQNDAHINRSTPIQSSRVQQASNQQAQHTWCVNARANKLHWKQKIQLDAQYTSVRPRPSIASVRACRCVVYLCCLDCQCVDLPPHRYRPLSPTQPIPRRRVLCWSDGVVGTYSLDAATQRLFCLHKRSTGPCALVDSLGSLGSCWAGSFRRRANRQELVQLAILFSSTKRTLGNQTIELELPSSDLTQSGELMFSVGCSQKVRD